jgi:hypothetical protein
MSKVQANFDSSLGGAVVLTLRPFYPVAVPPFRKTSPMVHKEPQRTGVCNAYSIRISAVTTSDKLLSLHLILIKVSNIKPSVSHLPSPFPTVYVCDDKPRVRLCLCVCPQLTQMFELGSLLLSPPSTRFLLNQSEVKKHTQPPRPQFICRCIHHQV